MILMGRLEMISLRPFIRFFLLFWKKIMRKEIN